MRNPIGKRMTVSLLAAGAVALGGAGTALATSGGEPADTQDEKRTSHVTEASNTSKTNAPDGVAVKKLPDGGIAVKKLDRDESEPGEGGEGGKPAEPAKPAEPTKENPTEHLDRGDDSFDGDTVPAKPVEKKK